MHAPDSKIQPQSAEALLAEADAGAAGFSGSLKDLKIPEDEYTIRADRAGGPGGMNVNKVNTKAVLRWSVSESKIFSLAQKARIYSVLENRINGDHELVLHEQRSRKQLRNRELVVAKLHDLLRKALKEDPKRRRTKRPKWANEKRLRDKQQRSRRKRSRSESGSDW